MSRAVLLTVVLGAVALCSLASLRAHAASYQVMACGGGQNGSWTATDNAPTFLGILQRCPPSGDESGFLAVDNLGLSPGAPAGSRAEWVMNAPPGTTISALQALRWALANGDGGWLAYLRDGAGNLLEQCYPGLQGGASCILGTPNGLRASPTAVSFLGLATTQLAFGITCRNLDFCITGAAEHAVGVSVHSATVTLEDPTPPLVTGPGTAGALASAGGWLSGLQTVTANASDQGGGVSRLLITGNGATVSDAPLACDFTKPAPCPLSVAQPMAIDTRSLRDGTVTFRLAVFDAAGQRSDGAAWTARVDNTPPGAPSGLLAAPAPFNAGKAFEVRWKAVADAAAQTTQARWRLIAPDARVAREGVEQRTAPASIPGLVVPGPGTWRVEVTLVDELGRAGPPASLTVPVGAAGVVPATARPGVRLQRTRVLVRVSPTASARRFGTRVLVGGRVVGAWRRPVRAGSWTLAIPLPLLARRATRVRIEWRPPDGGGWQRALVVRSGAVKSR